VIYEENDNVSSVISSESRMTTKSNLFKILMLVSIIISILFLILDLISTYENSVYNTYGTSNPNNIQIYRLNYAVNTVLIIKYIILTVAFFPLFIYLFVVLKRGYSPIYKSIKWKMIFLSSFYCLFNVARLIMYLDLRFFHVFMDKIQTDSEIPLYVSEIIMTLLICYIMFKVSTMS
jgi:hypothetical protein